MKSEREVSVRVFIGADFCSAPTFLDQDASNQSHGRMNW